MADQLGALTLPVQATIPQGSAGDPALDAIAGYLTAVLNADLGQVWQGEIAISQAVVQTTLTTNPENGAFQKEDMPILFVWRPNDGDTSEQWTDDLIRVQTNVAFLWVTRPADQPLRAQRSPMGNAVAAAIRRALRLGRHTAWVAPDETDTDSLTLGSVLMTHAGISEWPQLITCKPQSITIQIDESQARPYWAVGGSIRIAEVTTWDVTLNAPSKVDAVQTAGALQLQFTKPPA